MFKNLTMKKLNLLLVIALVLSMVSTSIGAVYAADTGAKFPTRGGNVDISGGQGWNNTSGITANNKNYADAEIFGSLEKNKTSDYLRAYDFGFNIPTDATINGITVEVNRSAA